MIIKTTIKMTLKSPKDVSFVRGKERNRELIHQTDEELKYTVAPSMYHKRIGPMHLSLLINGENRVISQYNVEIKATGSDSIIIEQEFYSKIKTEDVTVGEREIKLNGEFFHYEICGVASDPFSEKMVIKDLRWLFSTKRIKTQIKSGIVSKNY